MGQNLSEPKTEKTTEKYGNSLFSVASSSMQGWRLGMTVEAVLSSCISLARMQNAKKGNTTRVYVHAFII